MCVACIEKLARAQQHTQLKTGESLETAWTCLHPPGHPTAEREFKPKLLFLRGFCFPTAFLCLSDLSSETVGLWCGLNVCAFLLIKKKIEIMLKF